MLCPLLSLIWTVTLYTLPTSLAGKTWLFGETAPVVALTLNLFNCVFELSGVPLGSNITPVILYVIFDVFCVESALPFCPVVGENIPALELKCWWLAVLGTVIIGVEFVINTEKSCIAELLLLSIALIVTVYVSLDVPK